jgi:RNA polymerase sigma-70 factor (ECF subfamily)
MTPAYTLRPHIAIIYVANTNSETSSTNLAVTFFRLPGTTHHATHRTPVDTSLVIKRIKNGAHSAFAELVVHFQRPLFGYLGRMGLSQAAAQDIAQETFLRAWTKLADYDPTRAAFSTWLFTIARNLALTDLGKNRELTTGDNLPDVACESLQPPEAMQLAQRQKRVQAALRQLAAPDRSALALTYFNELGMADIARIEGCKVDAIKTRVSRARQRLRQLLDTELEKADDKKI